LLATLDYFITKRLFLQGISAQAAANQICEEFDVALQRNIWYIFASKRNNRKTINRRSL
jgi:hypothetical protein